jgi:HrpA-like RNA helicase
MVLLIYIIQANIPVIIMGETGCGKTAFITKLTQILNNGRKLLEIIKIHPGINDEKIYKAMKKMNELAKKQD